MKENNDLNGLFREADRFMEVDKEKRERTLERLHSAYEEINERTHVTAGYAETVLRQLRYMDKGIWIEDGRLDRGRGPKERHRLPDPGDGEELSGLSFLQEERLRRGGRERDAFEEGSLTFPSAHGERRS